MEGRSWKSISIGKRAKWLANAVCVSENTGKIVIDGKCIVELDDTLAIKGEIVGEDIIVDSNEKIYKMRQVSSW